MVNHGKEKARFLFSICSPTAAAFPELGEPELALPVVDHFLAGCPPSTTKPVPASSFTSPPTSSTSLPRAPPWSRQKLSTFPRRQEQPSPPSPPSNQHCPRRQSKVAAARA